MADRVMVAMSGGVDSSVAAALLVAEGYEVVGATMKLVESDRGKARSCCAPDAALRARRVCDLLDISHLVIDLCAEFEKYVIRPFCQEYARGRTPNPCVACNRWIKWDVLLRKAQAMGCRFLATGHYAIIERLGGRFRLRRGIDRSKDQSYALYWFSQQQLACTLLPLGRTTKAKVRKIAAELGLPTAHTPESQDICFVQEGTYRDLLASRIAPRPGDIVDEQGNVLGKHSGLIHYTVGQRKGLGISGGPPLFVLAKDAERNRLIVGPRRALSRRSFEVEDVNWLSIAPPAVGASIEAQVEVRYRARPIPCRIIVGADDTVSVELAPHDQAIAPGQAAVFYDDDLVLGGGTIR